MGSLLTSESVLLLEEGRSADVKAAGP
jgi:hypothetical protein